MADEVLLAFSTFPDVPTARDISRQLITGRFAACANILPNIESIYLWGGKLGEGNEALVLFKLSASRYADFEQRLRSLHPYEVPEIVTVVVNRGLPEYLRWVCDPPAA